MRFERTNSSKTHTPTIVTQEKGRLIRKSTRNVFSTITFNSLSNKVIRIYIGRPIEMGFIFTANI